MSYRLIMCVTVTGLVVAIGAAAGQGQQMAHPSGTAAGQAGQAGSAP